MLETVAFFQTAFRGQADEIHAQNAGSSLCTDKSTKIKGDLCKEYVAPKFKSNRKDLSVKKKKN